MNWPLWITVKYFVDFTGESSDQAIKGYRCSASSKRDLLEKFRRHNLHKEIICELIVNGEILNMDRKEKFFNWFDRIKKEVAIDEARKTTDKQTETINE